jgi:YidC/Oxa1 family membrane protein insertase
MIKTNIQLEGNTTINKYYYGPNNYQVLKKVAPGFSKNIYLGWPPVNLVNKFLIIPTFNFLDRYIANYGIIIILLVIFIKILLFPLTYKSYISMAKTKVLKPELDAIKEKHDGDMQKAQADQMALYRQVGVNPISGCIPLLLQMPILFSMFYFFPNSIELRQEAFLWADDLSTYDSVLSLPFTIPAYGDHVSLFTILMTLSTILYTWSNSQVTTVQGPMKSMQYMMPVVFMFVLNSFPAALSFYYFVSNLVTFGQQALIRKFVDEDKIKRILDENRKKNVSKKKSKFQMRLEEAMKAKEEAKPVKKKKR